MKNNMNEVVDVLNTALEYSQRLKAGITSAALSFQIGEESKGANLIPGITEGLQWILDVVMSLGSFLSKDREVENIVLVVNKIIDALEKEDYILLADLLEYELIPNIEKIENGMSKKIKFYY